MTLKLYDASQIEINNLTDYIVTNHNGYTGGDYQLQLLVKADNTNTHSNIELKPVIPDLIGDMILSPSGWSIKLAYTSAQPSEKQWNEIPINEKCVIPNISNQDYKSVWLRVYCPGQTLATIKIDLGLTLSYEESV